MRLRFTSFVCLAASVCLLTFHAPENAFAQKVVSPDFKVELLYSVPDIEHPSVVTCDDDGNLFVGEDPMDMRGPTSKEFDRVLFIKFGPDGKPMRKTVFCDNLAAVFGLVWHNDALYVMHAPHFSMFKDTDGDGVADIRKDLATGFGPPAGVYGFNDHIVTGTRLGLDGLIYVSVGDKGVPKAVGSDGSSITLEGGGVIRMRPDGSRLEIVSSGTRNHLDVAMDSLDNIFTYDNTDDGLGWWTRFTHHVPTGYYGYPYDYHPHPNRHLPRISEHGGGSPVGAACYRESAWPATYIGSPFFCEWGKQKVQRFKLKKKGISFEAEMEDFMIPDGSGEPFRPLDVCFSPDGKHMYLADWNFNGWVNPAVKGRLFRVTYTGSDPAVKNEPPRAKKDAPLADLGKSLGHPSHAERMRAQFLLADAITKANPAKTTDGQSQQQVFDVVANTLTSQETTPAAKVHGLWTLHHFFEHFVGNAAPSPLDPAKLWAKILADRTQPADARAQAARILGLNRRHEGEVALVESLATDPDAGVRLQAAIAIGRLGDPNPDAKWKSTDSGQPGAIVPRDNDTNLTDLKPGCSSCAADLMKSLGDEDPYVRHVVVQALRVVNNWSEIGDALSSPNSNVRAGALLALTGVYDEAAIKALAGFAARSDALPAEQAQAIEALSEVARRADPYVKGWWGTQPSKSKPARSKKNDWLGSAAVLAAIREATGAKRPALIRLAAIKAWREIADPEASALLREIAINDADNAVRREAVTSLALTKDKDSVSLFAKIAGDAKSDDALRQEAVKGISAIGSPEAVKQLIDIVAASVTSPELAALSIEALGKLKNGDSAGVIEKRLNDNNATVRQRAAEAFGEIRGAAGANRIAELLKDGDINVRKTVLAVLARSVGVSPATNTPPKGGTTNEVVPAMIAAAADPAVKFDAQVALTSIMDRRALPLYLDGLASPNADLRNASLNALVALRSVIGNDILKLHELNELPSNVRGPLQGVFSAPAPIMKWHLLGTIPKDKPLPKFDLSAAPDLTALQHVGERALKWKAIDVKDKNGRVNPGEHLEGPKDEVWNLAYAAIEAESDGPRTIIVGSDDQLIVHVNGKKVYEFMGNRGWDKAQGQFTADFKKGTNHLWMQCGNTSGPWDMSAAISQQDPKFAFLFENVAPKLDIAAFRDFANKNKGDADRGGKIFANPQGVACVKCHAVSGTGGKVGPDLVGIGARYPRDELMRSVLEPSNRIANGYDVMTVITNDGKSLTGILKLDSPEAVELMTVEGKQIRIANADIDEKLKSPVSLMPNGLKDGMTLQDFADIVAYLESLKQPPTTK